jgi:hypothetical protein
VKRPRPVPKRPGVAANANSLQSRSERTYKLTDDERLAIGNARRSELVPDENVKAFWKAHWIG